MVGLQREAHPVDEAQPLDVVAGQLQPADPVDDGELLGEVVVPVAVVGGSSWFNGILDVRNILPLLLLKFTLPDSR